MESLVGPFYDSRSVCEWLAITNDDVAAMITARSVLALPVGDTTVFPAWQFLTNGRTIPGLSDVLTVLAAGMDDPWTWALWMTSDLEDKPGFTAATWLAQRGDPAPIVAAAQIDAGRWSAP